MRILLFVAVLTLRVIYFFFKLVLKPQDKITLLSRQSDVTSVDFDMLYKALASSERSCKVKMLCKEIAPGIAGKVAYLFHILSQMYHIATSKVVVIDGYNIAVSVLNHKKNQKFVQLWHALNIVKKFGHSALDKPWGRKSSVAKVMCMHRNYTHIVACSEQSGKVLCECFGASRDKIFLQPLPRIEYILRSQENRADIEKVYPDVFSKPILLYAPTFRGEMVDLSWIEKVINTEKYNVVVKLHPADKYGIDKNVAPCVLCDSEFSSFEWMKVCDALITDYSGMGFEAMLRGKKVYYYLYDYKDYSQKNGLNLDLFSEDISEFVTTKPDELKALIEKEYNFSYSENFVKKYLSVPTDNCSKRLADFIISLI